VISGGIGPVHTKPEGISMSRPVAVMQHDRPSPAKIPLGCMVDRSTRLESGMVVQSARRETSNPQRRDGPPGC